nr:E3 ubiquitin-protein ligase TRIM58-like isoform X5 [Misgurnus anguillicaudatus]
MDRPVRFKETTQNIRLRPDEATSPAPSCTSLQSDQSMDRPVQFKETTPDIKLRPEEPASLVPSCTSLQSDQSMDRPVKFKESTPDISTLSATLLTEDHYRCSVCTEVFKNPVSIPCGHSYCKHCIEIYWSKPTQAECYACPQCRKRFRDRPVLNVNVALAKVIDELQQAGFSPALPAHCYAGPEDVSCDICTDMKLKAVKSCLTCCVSYCETHVRQHYTVPALQRHNLVEPCSLSWDNETTGTSIAVKRFQEDNKVFAATVTKLKSILKEKDAQAKRLCKGFEVHCKDFPSDIIEVSALSHPLCLGMLYGPENDYYSQSKT